MTTEISFLIEPSNKDIPLGFEVRLNNIVHFDSDCVDQAVPIRISVNDNVDAEHTLTLTLKNKLPQHTQISETGEIESDSVINISDILFDQIPVESIFLNQACYRHDFNGTKPMIEDKFFKCMGCNGTVELRFSTPLYLWLLENM